MSGHPDHHGSQVVSQEPTLSSLKNSDVNILQGVLPRPCDTAKKGQNGIQSRNVCLLPDMFNCTNLFLNSHLHFIVTLLFTCRLEFANSEIKKLLIFWNLFNPSFPNLFLWGLICGSGTNFRVTLKYLVSSNPALTFCPSQWVRFPAEGHPPPGFNYRLYLLFILCTVSLDCFSLRGSSKACWLLLQGFGQYWVICLGNSALFFFLLVNSFPFSS